MKKQKRSLYFIMLLYLAAVIYLLFCRHASSDIPLGEYARYNTNVIPFFSFYVLYTTPYISSLVLVPFFKNLIGNLVLFIPWGIMLPLLGKRYKSAKHFFLITAAVIICAELLQLVLRVGTCDIEDFLLNMLGAAGGYIIIRKLTQKKTD